MNSSLAKRVMSLAVVLVLASLGASSARADHESITIDGNLDDLNTAITNNLGSLGGGFTASSPIGNVYSGKCRFVNGFDAKEFLLFVDFKTAAGGVVDPGSVTLYAGWKVVGKIGDVDGDGIVDQIGGLGSDPCALSDGPPGVTVGPLESYRILGDLNCDNVPEIFILLKNDVIEITLAGGATVPAQDPLNPDMFAIQDSTLELRIGRLDALIPDMDLCNASFVMTANAENDGLGEDFGFMGQLEINPEVSITKDPPKQEADPTAIDQTIDFTITVKNEGLCILTNVSVNDVLDAGMTFVSSTPDRDAGGDDQNSNWTFNDVAAGATETITLTARIPGTCSQQVANNVTVNAEHVPPPACFLDPRTDSASATALVNCAPPPPCRISGPASLCAGVPLVLCGPNEVELGRNLSYRWTAPDLTVTTTQDSCMTFDPAITGVYTLVVIDNDTSVESAPCTHEVVVNDPPLCSITPDPSGPVCVGAAVSLCGPAGNFSYAWMLPNGSTQTTQCVTIASAASADAGTYTLVVTDVATGCASDPCTYELVVNDPPLCSITITAPGDNQLCVGESLEMCGPDGNFSYAWTLPNGSTQTTQCISITSATAADAGTYMLVVTDNATGCVSDPCTQEIAVNDPPLCSITGAPTGPVELGGNFEVCGPAGNFSYLWTLPNGSTQTGQCVTVTSAVAADFGAYTLVVTDNATGCSSDPCSVTVQQCDPPVCSITADPSGPVCLGAAVSLCGPAGNFTYAWMLPNGSTQTTQCVTIASATGTDAGIYTLVVTDNATQCQSDPCTYELVVNDPPLCSITITPPGDDQLCIGESLEMCGPDGNFSYAWTLPNGSTAATRCISITSATAADAGTYMLVVTDNATGCVSDPCTQEIVVSDPPVCSITGAPTGPVELGGNFEVCGPDGNFSYLWTLPNGSTQTGQCVTVTSAVLADFGSYTLVVTDNATGCASDPCAVAVSQCDPPVCNITPDPSGPVCTGTSVTLCGPDGNFTYAWTLPGSSTETTQCITIAAATSADAGIYSLVITDVATNCKSAPCTYELVVNDPPLCSITITQPGDNQLCVGESLEMCGPAGDFSYAWTLPGGSTETTQCITITAATSANAGTYTLVVTDNATGCVSDPCTQEIVVDDPPVCTITSSVANPVPVGSNVDLCGPDGDFSYAWTLPGGGTVSTRCVNIVNAMTSDAGTYTLMLTDNTTGCSSTCSYEMMLAVPEPCVITGPSTANPGETVTLCGPANVDSYLWMLPNGSTQTTQCITIGPVTEADEGTYTLTIMSGGVTETCTFMLTVNDVCENCPRSADWWSDECDGKDKGHPAFSPDDLRMIAECVDGLSMFFDWGTTPVAGGMLIERNSAWACSDTGLDLGTAWREASYNDAGWIVGPGVLGYGEDYVATQVSYGGNSSNKYMTTYFRKHFNVASVSGLSGLMLRATYDDGIVVYLNGVEVARRSIDPGPVSYSTQAHSHESWNVYEDIDLAAYMGQLRVGDNVLAVEVHQVDEVSSDMVFDAELEAIGSGQPVAGEWRYNDSGLDMGVAWRGLNYGDGSWATGSGIFGYGESYVTTEVSYGPDPSNKPITTYFRKVINVTGAASVTSMVLDLMYDDGVCVYINGVEVVRRSLDPGDILYDTQAHSHEANQQFEFIDLSAYVGLLNEGLNVIAAEVHQVDQISSDMVFDAQLDIQGAVTLLSNASWMDRAQAGLFGADVVDLFCAVFDAKPEDERNEAKAQFAALLANVCASGKPVMGKKNNGVCLNLDTPIDCKHFNATTVAALIDEIDALLAALEPQDLEDVEEQYENITECLEEINNGWSIPVPKKECSEDDKKGRHTPSGDHVVVELGPDATLTFSTVAIEGITYIAFSQGWVMPQGMMSLDGAGRAMELSSTATYSGDVSVVAHYDENLLQSPEAESELKLLRYDALSRQWVDVTIEADVVANTITGITDGLAPFVVAAPWTALSADDPIGSLGFAIRSSYPNPTSGRATVRYALTKGGPVRLTVHDVQGRQVATLESGHLGAGEHTAVWNGRGADGRKLSAGIYVIRLEAAEGLRTSKLVIMN